MPPFGFALVAILAAQSFRLSSAEDTVVDVVQTGLIWAMLAATVGSLVQYTVKAVQVLR